MRNLLTRFMKYLSSYRNSKPVAARQVLSKDNGLAVLLMINGDEIITTMHETNDTKVVCLIKPLLITRFSNDVGFNIHLNEWIPYTDATVFPVDKSSILTHSFITPKLKTFYDETIVKLEGIDEGSKTNNVNVLDKPNVGVQTFH